MIEKYSVILGNLGNTCDRFLSTGYKKQPAKEEMIRQAAAIRGVKGIELVGSWDVTKQNYREMTGLLADHGLECVSIIPDLFSQDYWGRGSLAAKDEGTRKRAMEYMKDICDIAMEMKCPLINIWPGQDGYDYPLQADFRRERGWMVENTRKLAELYPSLRFSLEYKPREPRNHSFLARTADTLLAALETGLDNVGVTIDFGHALYAYENVAESAVMLQERGKLFHLHFNDNYRYWDDDMIVGSVHLVEYVEFLYWIRETGYTGWFSMDQYPYREDGQGAIDASIRFIENIDGLLTDEAVGELRGIIARGNAVESTTWMRKTFLREPVPVRKPAGKA